MNKKKDEDFYKEFFEEFIKPTIEMSRHVGINKDKPKYGEAKFYCGTKATPENQCVKIYGAQLTTDDRYYKPVYYWKDTRNIDPYINQLVVVECKDTYALAKIVSVVTTTVGNCKAVTNNEYKNIKSIIEVWERPIGEEDSEDHKETYLDDIIF